MNMNSIGKFDELFEKVVMEKVYGKQNLKKGLYVTVKKTCLSISPDLTEIILSADMRRADLYKCGKMLALKKNNSAGLIMLTIRDRERSMRIMSKEVLRTVKVLTGAEKDNVFTASYEDEGYIFLTLKESEENAD